MGCTYNQFGKSQIFQEYHFIIANTPEHIKTVIRKVKEKLKQKQTKLFKKKSRKVQVKKKTVVYRYDEEKLLRY